jgi:hypothetical protein
MAKKGRAIYLVYTDLVDEKYDEAFNAWYDTRHVPQLKAIPGILVRYTTVYEFESDAVPESAAWNHQREHSSQKSGAMREAMTMAVGSPGVYRRLSA